MQIKKIKPHFSREFQSFEIFFKGHIRNGTNKKEEMVQEPPIFRRELSETFRLKSVLNEVFLPRRKKRKKSKKEGKLEVLPF